MRHAWALIAVGMIMLMALQASADPFSVCKADCEFRFNVRHDFGGTVQLPFDTLRREGYLKCLEECDKKSGQNMFEPDGD
jgi:hypothetical protein